MDEQNVSLSFQGSTDDDLGLMASVEFTIPVEFAKQGYDAFRCEMTEAQIQELRDALSAVLEGKEVSVSLDLELLDYGG